MQFIQSFTPLMFAFYLASFIVALVIIVFIHEFGHFIVGRWCGVRAEVFSVGFGKELLGFTDKHGTRWKLAAIPLGGYVRFEGDANAASMPASSEGAHTATSLHGKPVWQRAAIVAAGPFANFLLAISIFTFAYTAIGMPYLDPVVDEIIPNSAAAAAGVQVGDVIVSVDGKETTSFEAVQESVWMRGGEELEVTVNRAGQMLTLRLTPRVEEFPDGAGGKIRIGLLGVRHQPKAGEPHFQRFAPHEAFLKGVERTWYVIKTTGKFVSRLFAGQDSVKQLGGGYSIGKAAGDAASSGVITFVYFVGLLSVSIGLINLFPIPMLDGGHLLYYAIEAIRGRPLGQQAQEWGYRIGFTLVAMLLLVGNFNDIGRAINKVFGT